VVVQYEIGLAGIGSTVVANTDCRLSKPWVKVIDKGVSERLYILLSIPRGFLIS
jgi:hypothetical protein